MSLFRSATQSLVSAIRRSQNHVALAHSGCVSASNLPRMFLAHQRSPLLQPLRCSNPAHYSSTRLFHQTAARLALSPAERKKIDDAVHAHPVVVFMKGTPEVPQCGFSRAVVQILQVQGVKPESLKTYNVLEDSALREGIKDYSAWPTIPQLYVAGDFQGGADLALSMHTSGELEEVLTKAGALTEPTTPPAGSTEQK